MKRDIDEHFERWRLDPGRKPLLVWGARQIGKTYAIKQWATQKFAAVIEVNFQEKPSWKTVFARDLDPDVILRNLEIMLDRPILRSSTQDATNPNRSSLDLLFFDEIQECPEALTALKYFCEKKIPVPIIAAGSLLGVRLGGTPFPVGNVDILHMYPMCFGEFLQAVSPGIFSVYQEALSKPQSLSSIAHQILWEHFKDYLTTGGLPEVVDVWIKHGGHKGSVRSFAAARNKLTTLLAGYVADITKHSGKTNSLHIERVLRSIPTQLTGTTDDATQRYRFKDVLPGLKAYRDLAGPIDWLVKAGLALKRPICHSAAMPISAQTKDNIFKLELFDVGMLGSMIDIPLKQIDGFDFGTYKGFLVENFVAQELLATYPNRQSKPTLHSWNEGQAEIEFLLQSSDKPIPVEVKSGQRIRAKSLKSYIARWCPDVSIILSGREYAETKIDGRRQVNLPLYLAARVWTECESR